MAVSGKMYGNALLNALGGTTGTATAINWYSGAIKCMLCTSSYVPDQDAHIFKSSVTNEVVGTGYTAGGMALSNKTIVYTAGTNTIKLDADDTVWASSTITARYAVIYSDTGVAGTSTLIGYVDFGQDFVSTGGNFTITWDANGIFTSVAS